MNWSGTTHNSKRIPVHFFQMCSVLRVYDAGPAWCSRYAGCPGTILRHAVQTLLRKFPHCDGLALLDVRCARPAGLNFSFESVAPYDARERQGIVDEGEVAEGDLDRLLRFLREIPGTSSNMAGASSSSWTEATSSRQPASADSSEDALIEAWLPDASRTRCVSACFFMFVNAVSLVAVADSVGVHRPYFDASAWLART